MSTAGNTAGHQALNDEGMRALIGEPVDLVRMKVRPTLDEHCQSFIARSPFLCIGTVGADGGTDVSPRGDPPGFVKVLDDGILAIPERPGNKLADSLTNILETGHVGLLFLIPGIDETLRVNGTATLSDDSKILESMVVKGKPPKLAIRVEVEEAFLHCAKAFRRSKLWASDSHVDRSELPTLGQMLRDQIEPPDMTAEDIEEFAEEDYRTRLY